MKDIFSVEGRVTVVTGGGTGIGAVIAREFATRGAPVLIASRNAEHLEPVRDGIRKAGGKCEMMVCDVRNAESCDALVAEAVKHFNRLDVMINNHGASIAAPSLKLSPNGWRAVVSINLDGVFFCSRAAARQFIDQKKAAARSSTCPRRRACTALRRCFRTRLRRLGLLSSPRRKPANGVTWVSASTVSRRAR